MVKKSGKRSRQSDLDESRGSTESTDNVSKLDKILAIVEETKNDISEIKREISDIKSGLASLTSRVEDLELAKVTHENELSSIKQEISALRKQIAKEPGFGELATRALVVENMDRRRNIILWNIKGESKSKAKEHVNALLSQHLGINTQFELLEFTDRFIKIQLKDDKDKFCILQGNKKLRENPFRRVAGSESPYVYITDDVTKGVRDIRNSLKIKQKELREKGVSAWIPPVVPPVLCLIENEQKVKLKWYNVV
jgi:hypothetical protein